MINGSDCYLIIKQLNGAFNLSLDPGTASSIPPDVEVILLNPSTNYTYIFEGTANDGTKVIVHGSFETGKQVINIVFMVQNYLCNHAF